jgi:hypothetical protein
MVLLLGFLSPRRQELHVHLDGAFDPEFLFHLAREKLEQLPMEAGAAKNNHARGNKHRKLIGMTPDKLIHLRIIFLIY